VLIFVVYQATKHLTADRYATRQPLIDLHSVLETN